MLGKLPGSCTYLPDTLAKLPLEKIQFFNNNNNNNNKKNIRYSLLGNQHKDAFA